VNSEAQPEELPGVSGEAVAGWARWFEENWQEALEFRGELAANGMQVPEALYAKQLGLSVALTPVAYRCAHFGDTRVCPWCAPEPVPAEDGEVGRLQARLEEKNATIKRQSAAMHRQSAAIRQLQEREQQLLARLASRKPRLFRRD
jgi:hypothetical protein